MLGASDLPTILLEEIADSLEGCFSSISTNLRKRLRAFSQPSSQALPARDLGCLSNSVRHQPFDPQLDTASLFPLHSKMP